MERLREENQKLREVVKSKSQASSATSPVPVVPIPKRVMRRRLDEEEISLQDFFRLKTPKFRGKRGEDPQEFLKEIEKSDKEAAMF